MQNPNVLVTVEGLAGTPKHVVADAIAAEAPLASYCDEPGLETPVFDQAPRISAGDYFRAAAWLAIESKEHGSPIHRFYGGHGDLIRSYLADSANRAFLYEDPEIEKQVSDISSQMPGVEELCHRMFVADITRAHKREGRSLIVADALHPMDHLQRAGIVGDKPGQITPGNVLPIFVDSSPADAGRLSNDVTFYVADRARHRRQIDARRPQAQVRAPADRLFDIGDWELQFSPEGSDSGVTLPLSFRYSSETSRTTLSQFAGKIVEIAQIVSSRAELVDHQ